MNGLKDLNEAIFSKLTVCTNHISAHIAAVNRVQYKKHHSFYEEYISMTHSDLIYYNNGLT